MGKRERSRSPVDRKDDRRGGRGGDRQDRGRGRSGGPGTSGQTKGSSRRAPPERRIFVSNIPFEMKWQEIKDMFREEVGDVTYVELFNDENDKPRGCGILEFATEEMAKRAVEKMHRHEFRGRKLVVKEDFDTERDKYGRIITERAKREQRERERENRDHDRDRGRDRDRNLNSGGGMGGGGMSRFGNQTYGLSPQFLDSLGIDGPLHNRLFVANLAYSVDEKKLREVFRLAGRVVTAELNRDKDGKSRGHAVIEYDHPVEAVQAISMFNNQSLYDRKITVRFDKQPGPTPEELSQLPSRLPEGLAGIGMGLGSGGNPLTDVAKNLPNAGSNQSGGNQGSSPNAAVSAALGAAGLAQLQSLIPSQQMQPPNPSGIASLMGGNSQSNSSSQGGPNSGGGITNELSALAALARQLQNAGGLQGLAGLSGNMNGNNGPNSSTSSGMPMGMKNESSQGGMGMPQMPGSMNSGLGGSLPPMGGMVNPGNQSMKQDYGHGASSSMSGGSTGSMGGPNTMTTRPPQMGGSHGMHSSAGDSAVTQGHTGGHPASRGGGYNTGAVATSSSTGYGHLGNTDQSMMGRPQGAPGSSSGIGIPGSTGGNVGPTRSDSIMIRNLPPDCNWQILREGFAHCGEIKYAEMKEGGTGLIRFTGERDAERAVSMMNNQTIAGRTIDVRLF